MRQFSALVAASMAGLMFTSSALAQPRPYDGRQQRGQYAQGARSPGAGQYYYNGRWVDDREWQRRSGERDRWARSYRQRRGDNDSSSLIAGIVGFALGAAIVGSAQQAERARTADETWRENCARRYRSYDRASGTYMGYDGVRHYCQ